MMSARSVGAFISCFLISSCDQSHQVTPVPAAEAQSRVVEASDTRKVIYELREKCGRDAMDWFKHFHEVDDALPSVVQTIQNEYSDHYNEKLNRCYAMVLTTQILTKNLCPLNTMSLVDVNENVMVGDFFKNCDAPTPVRCSVAGKACASQEQFKQLAAPYLTN
jgi:hypothetical protein